MKIHDLIEHLTRTEKAAAETRSHLVKREIVESLLCDANGHIDLEEPLSHVNGKMMATRDNWIIFSREMVMPSKILIVGTRTKQVICHNIQSQFRDGFRALSSL